MISTVIAFLGRNTLNWFIDLTAFGAIVGFGYTSAAAWKIAKAEGNGKRVVFGILGTVISLLFAVVVVVFAFSLLILLNNYNLMSKRAASSELQLGKVRDMAYRDALTGLKNKLSFTEAENELDASVSAGEQAPFAIVVCDVNGLKYVNDTQGHKAGDEYIRSAGRLVCSLFEHSPVYRTGGDEFVAVLTGRDYEDREAIMRALHDRSVENIGKGKVVVSGGLAEYAPGQTPNCHAVFEAADTRMYEEKKLLKSLGTVTRL